MPLVNSSTFPGSPFWQIGGHLQTIIPGLFRKINGVQYQRERIDTPDGDFLDLDWIKSGNNNRLIVITHGLEASSESSYIQGMAKYFHKNNWDVLAWNCRSCSGEMNRKFRMYHHGDTEDICTVIEHAIETGSYETVVLSGFSMGANISMKYLGVFGDKVPKQVKAAAVFSAPCDIRAGADVLDRWDNLIYKYRFMYSLYNKVKQKAKDYPDKLDIGKFKKVRHWRDFDEYFSAPISGFSSAAEFHNQASAKNFLHGIQVPTLLVTAKNDPILTVDCHPIDIAQNNPFFYFELTNGGGHCGFQTAGKSEFSWSEIRALEFFSEKGIINAPM